MCRIFTLGAQRRYEEWAAAMKRLTDDAPVEIDLGAFRAHSLAKVEQITAVSRYVMNDEVEPKRVVPQVSSLHLAGKKPLTIILPHESVTVIHLVSPERAHTNGTLLPDLTLIPVTVSRS